MSLTPNNTSSSIKTNELVVSRRNDERQEIHLQNERLQNEKEETQS
jgi:hypothetical protein